MHTVPRDLIWIRIKEYHSIKLLPAKQQVMQMICKELCSVVPFLYDHGSESTKPLWSSWILQTRILGMGSYSSPGIFPHLGQISMQSYQKIPPKRNNLSPPQAICSKQSHKFSINYIAIWNQWAWSMNIRVWATSIDSEGYSSHAAVVHVSYRYDFSNWTAYCNLRVLLISAFSN